MVSAQDNVVLTDPVAKQLWQTCDEARLAGLFTSCSIGVATLDQQGAARTWSINCGQAAETVAKYGQPVCYDLASLTKIIVTAPCILILAARGKLALSDPLVDYWPMLAGTSKAGITIGDLLHHRSGLPAHREFFKELITQPENQRKQRLEGLILAESLMDLPGRATVYSDLGFLLLGLLVEKVTGTSLSDFWQENVALPAGFNGQLFFCLGQKKNKEYVPTGVCPWSGKLLAGEVHDDNCRSIGGVAGHAGLFGTLDGMLAFSLALLQLLHGQISSSWPGNPEWWQNRLVREKRRGRYVYGFDTPDQQNSSSGSHFSETSIGHLGFTGTSWWLDPKQHTAVILLTNRSYCGQDLTGIRQFRPKIHNLIMEEIKRLRKMRSLL